jgi:GWxTD domain-containing protein
MKLKLLLLFLVFTFLTSFAQGKFSFDYDYARFINDTSSYVEIYYLFNKSRFKIFNEGKEKYIIGSLRIYIMNVESKSMVVDKEYQFKSFAEDTVTDTNSTNLVGNIGFELGSGNYICSLVGKDLTDKFQKDSVQFKFQITSYDKNKFSVSDIQLAGSITESSQKDSPFYKNSYEIIPNPAAIYWENLPVIFFYSEIYNIEKNIKSNMLKVEDILYNVNDLVLFKKTKYISRNNSAIVEAGEINIKKIPTGVYNLTVSVTDTILQLSALSSKKLYIVNSSVVDTNRTLYINSESLQSEFSSMEEDELDYAFNVAKYIATKLEISRWDKLSDLNAKRSFMAEFWKKRDKTPETPQNKFQTEYMQRVDYANEHFTAFARKGWKTDMGRVYIVYGPPSEIERHPSASDSKPYEIWHYDNIEGGVIFVFADLSGFNEYLLVNSTKQSEIHDDNWQSRIQVVPESDTNSGY